MYDWLYQNLPSYPGQSNTSAETSMYYWLYHNLPWTKKGSYTPDRWKKLNDAFGEGWEADFGKKARESQLETNGTSNDEPRSRIVQGEDPDRVRVLVVDCWLLVVGLVEGRRCEVGVAMPASERIGEQCCLGRRLATTCAQRAPSLTLARSCPCCSSIVRILVVAGRLQSYGD